MAQAFGPFAVVVAARDIQLDERCRHELKQVFSENFLTGITLLLSGIVVALTLALANIVFHWVLGGAHCGSSRPLSSDGSNRSDSFVAPA